MWVRRPMNEAAFDGCPLKLSAQFCCNTQLSAMLSRFGLTPADRSRVVATVAPKEESEWAELDEPQQTM